MYLNGVFPRGADRGDDMDPHIVAFNSFRNATPLRFTEMKFRTVNYGAASRACVNPCNHGGTCEYSAREDAARCTCTQNFAGDTCDETPLTESSRPGGEVIENLGAVPTDGILTATAIIDRRREGHINRQLEGQTIAVPPTSDHDEYDQHYCNSK